MTQQTANTIAKRCVLKAAGQRDAVKPDVVTLAVADAMAVATACEMVVAAA